ncbi:MAG: DUF3857 domain-containing transglutaminase family protein [Bacteroidota bacterium]|nr:MAG: DUF3857 domain-containing transglutaminase family protein [Bacteroidota bacterium]
MKAFLYSLILFLCTNGTILTAAEKNRFNADSIPRELKINAQSVIRYFNQTLVVNSESDAAVHISYAITILNKNGLSDSYFREYYDDQRKIKSISAAMYNASGELIKQIGTSGFFDVSAIPQGTIYSDSRVKVYTPAASEYPFTIEYKFIMQLKGYINLPTWNPYMHNEFVSVENAQFELQVNPEMKVRVKQIDPMNLLVKESFDDTLIQKWQVSKLPAIESEIFAKPYGFFPMVIVAPEEFFYDGYYGNSSSWSDLGKWLMNLNEGRDILPIETKSKILQLVSDSDNTLDKIKLIYKYVQDNTRYVSVQLGIGGFQPFEADFVDRVKYGDCKALTNYTMALLKATGINSFYTVVGAGSESRPVLSDFPYSQFNHAFLCVPLDKDTLWLECTSMDAPCGFMGSFTDDRDVLVVNENGGHLVRTPAYSASENRKTTRTLVDVFENGDASANIHSVYEGALLEEVFDALHLDKTDREKSILDKIGLPKAFLKSHSYEVLEQNKPKGIEQISLEIGRLAVPMGSNVFLTPNFMNQIGKLPGNPGKRISDISIRRSYSEVDTIVYNLPESFGISSLPEPETLETDFASYHYKIEQQGNKLMYTRYFELKKGEYPKERIHELYDFAKLVSKADNLRLVLKTL